MGSLLDRSRLSCAAVIVSWCLALGCGSSPELDGGVDAARPDAGPDAARPDAGSLDAGVDARAADACVPDCIGRECGPDPRCGVDCGTCPAPTFCHDDRGSCLDIELSCPASGAPFTTHRSSALGIATNELMDGRYDDDARFASLAQAGVGLVQLGVGWRGVEATPDARDWTRSDALLGAAHDAGHSPIVLFTHGAIPDDEPRWRAFVRDTVLRYGSAGRGWVSEWQLGNEPDNPGNPFYGQADEYVRWLGVTYEEVRAADPGARLWAPSIVFHHNNDGYGDGTDWPATILASEPMRFLDRVLELGRLDVVSVHIYEPSPARMLDVHHAIVDRMAARGRRATPLAVNEGHFGLAVSPPGSCPYASATEAEQALDLAQFYSCLFATNAAHVLWFNANDRFTPGGSPCTPDHVRRTGVLAFARDPLEPTDPFEPAVRKESFYVLRELAAVIERQRVARARLEAVPSPCRLDPVTRECRTSLVWQRRDPTLRALHLRRDGATVACTLASEEPALFDAVLGEARARFDLVEAPDCEATASSEPLDTVFVRGRGALPATRAAIVAIDEPCRMDASGVCSVALATWSEGVDATRWPFVKLYAGANVYACVPSSTIDARRSGAWHGEAGILYRLYEAESCAVGAREGRLLATTRAYGALPD